MKKIILLLSVVMLVFASCSKNEDMSSVSSSGTLLTKYIVSSGNTVLETFEYFYNGNKLTRIKESDIDYANYTYTNDLITKIDRYKNNVLYSTADMSYNIDNKLSQVLSLIPSLNKGYKEVYTYNSDGTVSLSKYSGDLVTQVTNTENYKVFFQNGIAIKREEYKLINGNMETLTTNYAYDTKNEIHNSILGFNKLTAYDVSYFGVPNNIISLTYSATNSTNISQGFSAYTYNDNNYPITKTDTNSSNNSVIVFQLFYQ
jgi:hypothetical protein